MTVVQVDSQEFQLAASDCYQANQAAAGAVSTLAGMLSGCAGMAGSDSGGAGWAQHYDPAARSLLDLGADLANALGVAGDLLTQTAANHADADAASTAGNSYSGHGSVAGGRSTAVSPAEPPSAFGGPSDPPYGWNLIAHLIAYVWPNGQQDLLRRAGQAWRSAGSTMTAQDGELSSAVSAISAQRTPEATAAAARCQQLQAGLTELGNSAAGIASACDQYADYLDQAHRQVIDELISLAEWTVVIEATGVVLTAFTVGISDAAAQGAVAARCAAAAARIGGILGRLVELAGELAQTIVDLAAQVIGLAQKIKTFLATQVSKAATAAVSRLPGAARAIEAGGDAMPKWLKDIKAGRAFNEQNYGRYPANEVRLENGKILDSYRPGESIVSRKYSQLSEVQESTASRYIDEVGQKYSPGETIANTPRNRELFPDLVGKPLTGNPVLEVPVQKNPIPQAVLDRATDRGVTIMDINGKIYN